VSEAGPAARPRLVRLALPVAALLLTVVFSVALFPWQRLDARLVRLLEDATGAQVSVGDLGPGLGLAGPRIEAHDVRLRWPPEPAELALDLVRVRPAWSLSWLRGDPALHVELAGEVGRLAGTVWPGGQPAFDGRLQDVDPTRLPPRLLGGVFPPVTGRLSAEVELATGDGLRPTGRVALDARDGSLVVPGSPVAIPFDALGGRLDLAPDGAARLEDVRLEGPLVSLSAAGRIGAAPAWGRAPLELDVELLHVDPAFAGVMGSLGAPGAGRAGAFRIGGTLARPEVTPR
jgi:type II secretion system protein N